TIQSLSWALKVALTWVTFIAGTRISEVTPRLSQLTQLIPFGVGYVIFLVFSLFVFGLFNFSASPNQTIAVALILSAALFSSKENPFLLAVLILSLFYLFENGEVVFT